MLLHAVQVSPLQEKNWVSESVCWNLCCGHVSLLVALVSWVETLMRCTDSLLWMMSQCRIIHVSNHFFIFLSLCASVVLQFVDCFQAVEALFTRDFIFITSLPLNSKYFKTTEYDAEWQAPPPLLYRTAQFCYMCLLTQRYSCRLVQETFREQLWFRKCLMCFCVLFVEHTASVLFHDHHFIEGSRNQIQGWNLIISLPYKLLINIMWQFYMLLLLFSLMCSRDATLDDSVSLPSVSHCGTLMMTVCNSAVKHDESHTRSDFIFCLNCVKFVCAVYRRMYGLPLNYSWCFMI